MTEELTQEIYSGGSQHIPEESHLGFFPNPVAPASYLLSDTRKPNRDWQILERTSKSSGGLLK